MIDRLALARIVEDEDRPAPRVHVLGIEHGGDLAVVRADVAFDESVVVLERAKRGLGHGGIRKRDRA